MTFYESAVQGRVMVWVCLLGACAGLLLDIWGVLFRKAPRGVGVAADVMLCACMAMVCAHCLVALNAGEFRFYAVLCAGVGVACYCAFIRLPLVFLYRAAKRRRSGIRGE